MNPNENNPTSPAGASGAAGGTPSGASSSTMPPLDFTGTSSNNGLSMADSLASAQDNLTSAGQAANLASNTLGIDQLGNASATMETPNTPLTPAAPVPGSIGSVTSVPPLKTAESNPTPVNPTTSSMPVMGGGSASTTTTPASATSSSSYYNPFAQPGANNTSASTSAASSAMPSSSTAVPPALQPQTEKFSDRLKSQGAPKTASSLGRILAIVGWVVALIAVIVSIFFFIQWQDAERRANEKEIVYIPSPEPGNDDDATEQSSTLTCEQFLGGETIEGIDNIVDHSRVAVVSYQNNGENHTINNALLTDNWNFTDNLAAEAARWYFDAQADAINTEGAFAANVELVDNVVSYTISGSGNELFGSRASALLFPVEGDTAFADMESVQQNYEAQGFVCTVE